MIPISVELQSVGFSWFQRVSQLVVYLKAQKWLEFVLRGNAAALELERSQFSLSWPRETFFEDLGRWFINGLFTNQN